MEKIIEVGSGVVCAASLALFLLKNINVKLPKCLQEFLERLENNERINTILISMLVGTAITALIGCLESEHAEQQIKIQNRETAAFFRVERTNEELGYNLIWEKGMGSYVTVQVIEKYNFTYKGEQYEADFLFFDGEKEQRNSISEEHPKLEYGVEYITFDKDTMCKKLSKNIEIYLGEKVKIHNTKEIKVHFYDYQNQYFTFVFRDDGTDINLIETEENQLMYMPEHNVTEPIRDGVDLDERIQDALDWLSKSC